MLVDNQGLHDKLMQFLADVDGRGVAEAECIIGMYEGHAISIKVTNKSELDEFDELTDENQIIVV